MRSTCRDRTPTSFGGHSGLTSTAPEPLDGGQLARDGKAKATSTRGRSRRSEGYDRSEVREWAKAHRIKVAPRGRIATEVVEKWKAATKK